MARLTFEIDIDADMVANRLGIPEDQVSVSDYARAGWDMVLEYYGDGYAKPVVGISWSDDYTHMIDLEEG